MLEQQRQAYLEAMGVPLWFPRYQLPGALPTPDYHWPETTSQDLVDARSAASLTVQETSGSQLHFDRENLPSDLQKHFSDQPKVAKQQIRESLIDKSKDHQSTANAANITQQPSQETEQSTAVFLTTKKEPCFFQLVCLEPNEQVLLITELPYSGVNELSALHYSLMNNLLVALKINDAVKEAKSFKWPFTHQPFIDQSERIAKAAVKAYLREQLDLSDKKLVIFMGPAAAKFGLGLEQDFDSWRGTQQQGEQWIAVTHSINEILRLPQCKKEAWKDLVAVTDIDWQ
ncbi:uracil-DNA glycosylase family protein [Spartinivicinus ruber]|uniref:hypothetical protein n=1 Tax=Spartinivicinus ruber TaxID=2683272 RepID=UPI0013D45DA4|nr:hypothetical protein [Spartinivicinus ruber]